MILKNSIKQVLMIQYEILKVSHFIYLKIYIYVSWDANKCFTYWFDPYPDKSIKWRPIIFVINTWKLLLNETLLRI